MEENLGRTAEKQRLKRDQISSLVDLLLKGYPRMAASLPAVVSMSILPEALNSRVGQRRELVRRKAVLVHLDQQEHIPDLAPRIGCEFGLDQTGKRV
jgi:hypothetical protein